MKTEFTFWGHNCFLVETEREALLIDPWLTAAGAFCGSWHQWPPNSHLRDTLVQRCADKRLSIFITHEHQDHFDKETLEIFAQHSDCTVFVPFYKDKFLLDTLRGMQLQTAELEEGQWAGQSVRFRIYIDDACINHDSAIYVEAPGLTFFNQNDCKIFDRLQGLLPELGKVDYYSVQFSGANWYPACFEMQAEQRSALSKKNALNKLRNVREGVKMIAPRFFVPAAGPACFPFLDPTLSSGTGTNFIHQESLNRYLVQSGITNVLYPRPGERIAEDTSRMPIPGPTPDELETYRAAHPNAWEEVEDSFSKERFAEVLQRRLDTISDLDLPSDTPLIAFNWGPDDADWLVVDLVKCSRAYAIQPQQPFVILTASTKYFSLMCGKERWQDISLSLRASVMRVPDVYNTIANIFLFADESNLAASVIRHMNMSKERIVIEHRGERYEIDRYCPHQGGDLLHAKIDDSMHLVCPRHSWRFDLNCEGKCKMSGTGIHAVKLVANEPAPT